MRRRPDAEGGLSVMTALPPPGEPDIYYSLAEALRVASAGIRRANELSLAALDPIDRAIELTVNTPELLRQARELSQRAWELREQARALAGEGPADADALEQADGLRRQADALMSRAAFISEQIAGAVLESRGLMRQGIEQLRASSEVHRAALESAAALMTAARRRQTNGGNPDGSAG